MTQVVEYELSGGELDVLAGFAAESKETAVHAAAAEMLRLTLRQLAIDNGADYLTVDGERVVAVSRTYPVRFDASGLKQYDPRLYEQFRKPADAEVITLRLLGKR